MTASRREFIKKSTALTVLSSIALETPADAGSLSADADIQLCMAYFYGLQERKMELSRHPALPHWLYKGVNGAAKKAL